MCVTRHALTSMIYDVGACIFMGECCRVGRKNKRGFFNYWTKEILQIVWMYATAYQASCCWHLFLVENTSYFTFEIRVEWNEWLFFLSLRNSFILFLNNPVIFLEDLKGLHRVLWNRKMNLEENFVLSFDKSIGKFWDKLILTLKAIKKDEKKQVEL